MATLQNPLTVSRCVQAQKSIEHKKSMEHTAHTAAVEQRAEAHTQQRDSNTEQQKKAAS